MLPARSPALSPPPFQCAASADTVQMNTPNRRTAPQSRRSPCDLWPKLLPPAAARRLRLPRLPLRFGLATPSVRNAALSLIVVVAAEFPPAGRNAASCLSTGHSVFPDLQLTSRRILTVPGLYMLIKYTFQGTEHLFSFNFVRRIGCKSPLSVRDMLA